MENLSPLASTIEPHLFVGCWGYATLPELDEKLNWILAAAKCRSQMQRFSCQTSVSSRQPMWKVAYLGLDQPPVAPPFLAALSASGLCTPWQDNATYPDAWVKLEGRDRLILGREPFGRVPLYWMQSEQVLWFSSRLDLLLPIVTSPQVSVAGLYGYSCFSYVPTPCTPIEGVLSVPAGTELVWQGNPSGRLAQPQLRRSSIWQEATESIRDETIAITELQTLLKDAIQQQIADLTDEPVGVLLSGGLDSSIVAALLVQAGMKVRAYTLDFGTAGVPESAYAEQVAEWLNIPIVKVDASPRRIQSAIVPTVQALDLPYGDGVTVPLFLLAKAASQETRVIFNGEGGDQLFAGWTNKPLIAAGLYQAEHPAGEEPFRQQYLRTFHRLWGYESRVFQPEVYAQIQTLQADNWLCEAIAADACPSLLHRLRRANLMLKGAQNIHPRATQLGFAHGLQVRSPFCNLSLANWTFQLAGELCLQGACEKYILKKAVEDWLPASIVWRPKRGMGVPLTSWCLNELWHQLGVWLNPGVLQAENRWQPQIATHIVNGKLGAAIQGRRIGETLWLLIIWQIWRSQVLGEPIGEATWNHPFWLPNWIWKYSKQWKESV